MSRLLSRGSRRRLLINPVGYTKHDIPETRLSEWSGPIEPLLPRSTLLLRLLNGGIVRRASRHGVFSGSQSGMVMRATKISTTHKYVEQKLQWSPPVLKRERQTCHAHKAMVPSFTQRIPTDNKILCPQT